MSENQPASSRSLLKLKVSVWLSFGGLFVATMTTALMLWIFEDLVLDIRQGRPVPRLTEWAFNSQAQLPLLSVPWFVVAVYLTRRPNLADDSVVLYAVSCFLAAVMLLSFALIGGLLPLMNLVPTIR